MSLQYIVYFKIRYIRQKILLHLIKCYKSKINFSEVGAIIIKAIDIYSMLVWCVKFEDQQCKKWHRDEFN